MQATATLKKAGTTLWVVPVAVLLAIVFGAFGHAPAGSATTKSSPHVTHHAVSPRTVVVVPPDM